VTRRRHLAAIVAALTIVTAACGSSTPSSPPVSAAPSAAGTASASPSTAPFGGPSGAPGESAAPSGPAGRDVLYATSYRPEAGRSGGEVVVGDWRPVTNLNPYYSTDPVDAEVLGATMRSLLRLTADGRWATDLAADPIDGSSIVRDRTGTGFSVKVTLKPGLRWSDGQPLTLADWAFTRQWILDKGQNGVNALDWQKIDRIDVAKDGLSGAFHFADASTDWLSIVGLDPPLPKHYLADVKPAAGATAYPLSDAVASAPVSGPYRYESASPAAVVLVRNPEWHAGAHPPYLDRDRKSTRLNSSHELKSRMPSSA